MKKFGLLILFIVGVGKFSSAQTINISGTVKTGDGDALHLAFVQDKLYKNGVYTDSLGNFGLAVNPNSKLHVTCRGFRDTLININNRTSFLIVLEPLVHITATRSNIPPVTDPNRNINVLTLTDEVSQILSNPPGFKRLAYVTPQGEKVYAVGNYLDASQGAIFPIFTHKEETKGSRYFVNGWVHGYVVNSSDSLIQRPEFFYNYDKMSGDVLLTQDKVSAIAVYHEKIKSFTLFDALNQPHTFTLVPDIDKTHYVQIISDGSTYKIYKLTKTKFIASNYHSDGIASTGNPYDEFQDDDSYFVVYAKTNQVQKLALKKKAIKQAFAADENKVTAYLQANDGDIDENYLHDFGDYMNK